MRNDGKLLLASLAAALLLSLTVGSASAGRFRISSQSVRLVWSALRFIAGSNTVTCHVTLEGSFSAATTAKVVGTQAGRITTAAMDLCTGGTATILSESLPWHILYRGFSGTLPRITSIQVGLVGVGFEIQPSGFVACLALTETGHPAVGDLELEASGNGVVTEEDALDAGIPIRGSGGLCPFAGEGHFEGNGTVTVPNSTTRITVTLI